MISFQILDDGKTVGIECDDAGVDALIGILESLRGTGGHKHLYAPSFGADVSLLSDQTSFGQPAVSQVIIGHGGD